MSLVLIRRARKSMSPPLAARADQRRELDIRIDVDSIGERLQHPPAGAQAAAEADHVGGRVRQEFRGPFFVAVELERRGKLAVQRPDFDGIGAVTAFDHQRIDRNREGERGGGRKGRAVENHEPLETDLHSPVARRGVILDDDRIVKAGALDRDSKEAAVHVLRVVKLLVVDPGIGDGLAMEIQRAAFVRLGWIENRVLARLLEHADGVQRARPAVQDAGKATVFLECEGVARTVAAGEVFDALEPDAAHLAGVGAVDGPADHRLAGASESVGRGCGAAYDLVDGRKAADVGGRHLAQVDADRAGAAGIVQHIDGAGDCLVTVRIRLAGDIRPAADLAGNRAPRHKIKHVGTGAALEILDFREGAVGLQYACIVAVDRPGLVAIRADHRVAQGLSASLDTARDRSLAGKGEVVVRTAADQVFDSSESGPTRNRAAACSGDDPIGVHIGPENLVAALAFILDDGVSAPADCQDVDVVAGAPGQRVVAGAADETVGAGVADERVVARAANDILDVGDVTGGRGAGGHTHTQINRHGLGESGVVEGVASLANALDNRIGSGRIEHVRVVTRTTRQRIIARPADEVVGLGVAGERVVARAANDILDMAESSYHPCRGPGCQIDIYRGRKGGIVEGVRPPAAVNGPAKSPRQRKTIVARASHQRFDAGERVHATERSAAGPRDAPVVIGVRAGQRAGSGSPGEQDSAADGRHASVDGQGHVERISFDSHTRRDLVQAFGSQDRSWLAGVHHLDRAFRQPQRQSDRLGRLE